MGARRRSRPIRALLTGVAIASLMTVAPSSASAAEPSQGTVVAVGSNASDPVPKASLQQLMDECAARTGIEADVHTFDHAAFQDGIVAYLAGSPDQVFTWFGGYRMRYLAARGLVADLSDIWATDLATEYSATSRALSTGVDGKQYLVPIDQYPWVVLYRRSVFQAHGYAIPTTLAEFVALAQRMKADGLIPLAFGDAEGWPAMGLFDILDMRLNGYRFHMDLMTGRATWTDARVQAVFKAWADLLPYLHSDPSSRTWQDEMRVLMDGRAGMYFVGTFAIDQATDPAIRDDVAMFPFPLFGNGWDAERAIDAPVDGLMLSRGATDGTAARTLLRCAGSGPAQVAYVRSSVGVVAANATADRSGYTPFQRAAADAIAASGSVAQFLDRDTRPDFAGPNGMQAFLRDFLADPGQDLAAFTARIQAAWDSLPPLFTPTVALRASPPAGTIARGTSVLFTATVRPLVPGRATVRFAVYRRVGGISRLVLARDVVAGTTGQARLRFTFSTAGDWYVRARVVRGPTFAGSVWTSPIRYLVR